MPNQRGPASPGTSAPAQQAGTSVPQSWWQPGLPVGRVPSEQPPCLHRWWLGPEHRVTNESHEEPEPPTGMEGTLVIWSFEFP